MTGQRSPSMQGPEGRPPNVSPARKGWEIDPEEYPSAVGAALNRSSPLPVLSQAADSLKRVGREMTKHVPSAISKGEIEGIPGLAFETWDPSNQFPLETPTRLFVIRSAAEDLRFRGPFLEIFFDKA
jgi:hypothetical protein